MLTRNMNYNLAPQKQIHDKQQLETGLNNYGSSAAFSLRYALHRYFNVPGEVPGMDLS